MVVRAMISLFIWILLVKKGLLAFIYIYIYVYTAFTSNSKVYIKQTKLFLLMKINIINEL